MALSRRRSLFHRTHRDFDFERAQLLEGHEEEVRMYQGFVDKTLSDPSLSGKEKAQRLSLYRDAILQSESTYRADLEALNAEELQAKGEEPDYEGRDLSWQEAAQSSAPDYEGRELSRQEAAQDSAPDYEGRGLYADQDTGAGRDGSPAQDQGAGQDQGMD